MKRYIDVDALIKDLKSMQVTVVGARSVSKTWLGKLINEYSRIIDRQPIITDVVSKEDYDNLEYKLIGVMHSVDKWLDDEELEQDEVKRADTMREKTLKIIEDLEKENKTIRDEAVKEVARRIKTYYSHPNYQRPYAHTMILKLMDVINTITKDMTGDVVLDYAELSPKRFTPEDVRQMTRQEVRENLKVILDSMDDWEDK